MNQESTPETPAMPKVAAFFLTNKVPCAFLVLMMLTSAYWLNALFGQVPLLGFLMVVVGLLLMMSVPTVFALLVFGGGLSFALQVGGIVALAIFILSSESLYLITGFLVVFVALPAYNAQLLQRENGFHHAAWSLALAMLALVFFAMWIAADSSIEAVMREILAPLFDNMLASVPAGDTSSLESIQGLRDIMVMIFPGLVIFSIWLTWWGDMLFGRKWAMKYGFFRGDTTSMLDIRLPVQIVYALIACIALANIASGDIAYVATNCLLVLAGLIAVQGVAVGHTWLKSREMMNTIVIMYVMLFFWSAVVLLFMLLGLFDIWFNYRRNMVSAIGDK